jgi:hypothetical protein
MRVLGSPERWRVESRLGVNAGVNSLRRRAQAEGPDALNVRVTVAS